MGLEGGEEAETREPLSLTKLHSSTLNDVEGTRLRAVWGHLSKEDEAGTKGRKGMLEASRARGERKRGIRKAFPSFVANPVHLLKDTGSPLNKETAVAFFK